MLYQDAACLAVDPVDFNRVYALGKVSVGSLFGMGVFASTDGGLKWAATLIHNESGSTGNVIALDPTAPRTIYAGGETGLGYPLLYRSSDGGATWAKLAGPFVKGIKAIAVNPRASGEIYVGTAKGLWRSRDNGATWTKCPGIASALAVAVDDADPTRLFAGGENGVFVSVDKGASWKSLSPGLKTKAITSLLYNSALRTLFVGTRGAGVCAREI